MCQSGHPDNAVLPQLCMAAPIFFFFLKQLQLGGEGCSLWLPGGF